MIFLIRCSRAGWDCAKSALFERPARMNDAQIAKIRRTCFLFMGWTSSGLQICTETIYRARRSSTVERRMTPASGTHLFETDPAPFDESWSKVMFKMGYFRQSL